MKAPTRAARELVRLGIEFELLEYEVPTDLEGSSLGEAAARALRVPAESCFKTLVALVDGEPVCAVVPVSASLSMKALAAAAGGKRAELAPAPVATRVTGYVLGGVSPVGQVKRVPTFFDASVLEPDRVYVSAGKRGLEIAVRGLDVVRAARGTAIEGLSAT